MNIASRMESTGEANRVQLSPSAAARMAEDRELAPLIRRRPGETEVKGQGAMHTSWLQTAWEAAATSEKRSQVLHMARRGKWSRERLSSVLGERSRGRSENVTVAIEGGFAALGGRTSF